MPDAESPRTRLLTAAAALFADKGYGSVSVREICKAAGTSINMVHHYFGSKEGLLDEIMARFDEGVFTVPLRLLRDPAPSAEAFEARLALLFETTLEAYVEHRDVLSVAVQQHRPLPAAIAFMTRFAAFLEEAKAQGYVRAEVDSALVSGAILDRVLNQVHFAPWIRAASGHDVVQDAEYRQAWARANLDLFLRGFLA